MEGGTLDELLCSKTALAPNASMSFTEKIFRKPQWKKRK